jgi:hypothetical protein
VKYLSSQWVGSALNSIGFVTGEIERFLRSKEAEVLCVTGDWGVGKTFTWNRLLKEAADSGEVGRTRYSYVSLFGLNSLAEVKSAIAANTQIMSSEKVQPVADIANAVIGSIKHLKGFVSVIPYIGKGLYESASLLFASIVNNQIVCIDDLDRRGAGISIDDILGLVTSLRDERNCNVLLLLNEEKLDDKEIYYRHFEKAIDARLIFSPSAEDAVEHGISVKDDIGKEIAKNSVRLGISNIRVVRKIERLVRTVQPHLVDRSEAVRRQTIHTLVILGWAKFQPDFAPPFEFLSEPSIVRLMNAKNDPMSDQEVAWTAITEGYDFSHMDDYDNKLLQFVRAGMLDPEALSDAASFQDAEFAKQDANRAVEKGFEPFHGSFANNVDEVTKSIRGALEKNFKYVNLQTLHAAVQMLKSIERHDDARALLKFYEDSQHDPEFWEPEHDPFGRPIDDKDVKSAIAKCKREDIDDFNLELDMRAAAKSYNSELISKIASRITAEDVKVLISARTDADMKLVIYAGLEYQKIGNASDDMKKIVAATKEAILLLALQSPLNAIRARKFGVTVEHTG